MKNNKVWYLVKDEQYFFVQQEIIPRSGSSIHKIQESILWEWYTTKTEAQKIVLPPIPPSIRVFSNESTLRMNWPKCWSFSFSISPSSEHPGLVSVRMDWLDLLVVQGILKSLLQHRSSKA